MALSVDILRRIIGSAKITETPEQIFARLSQVDEPVVPKEESVITVTLDELKDLCQDLQLPETLEQIFDRMTLEGGLRGAARYYGASFASYSCHQLAGRLGYADMMAKLGTGSFVTNYVNRVRTILRPEVIKFMDHNASKFQKFVSRADKRFSRQFDWLMFMSHETSYLLRDKFNGNVIETPALMHFRVISELFYARNVDGSLPDELEEDEEELGEALACFEMATHPYFSFASPVFFNSGHKCPNLCSCFLMGSEDSLTGIMGSMYKAALVSKAKGGIGLNVSGLRHSSIGHDGHSGGVVPMLQVYDRLIRYVDQTGKRNGASTVFIQAHHLDLMAFIRSTLKNADSANRLDALNTAIIFPDLFWERVKENGTWTLFCPAIFPGLNELFGNSYRELYLHYETMPLNLRNDKYRVKVSAREVVDTLADSQIMSGMPYVLHKDSINSCSNQVNLNSSNPLHHRTIQASNLCLEIMEQTDSEEVACCNLGQMSLKAFVLGRHGRFDFKMFGYVVRSMVKYLDRVIDRNRYVFPEAKTSNMRHRPIGLGVSGYADMLDIMGIAYESDEASELNRQIFACMYYNAMVASLELAIKNGPYSTFWGSPLSEGKFSFDLWKIRRAHLAPTEIEPDPVQPSEWNQQALMIDGLGEILNPSWDDLRKLVMEYGVRNSQMIAVMPSASTSRLMGNAENTEAHQSNLYIRNFMKASAVIINPQLFTELDGDLKLWSRDVAEFIVSQAGSVAKLSDFLLTTAADDEERAKVTRLQPQLASLCARYKTMFEIKQLKAVEQTAARHRYVCQGISFNVYLAKPTRAMLRNLHLATWKSGLKTGIYYLREPVPSEAPEYARTSSRVKAFLTGPVMRMLSVHHEPFPQAGQTTVQHRTTVELIDEPAPRTAAKKAVKFAPPTPLVATTEDEEQKAFAALLEADLEVVSADMMVAQAARDSAEVAPTCKRQAGCASCE